MTPNILLIFVDNQPANMMGCSGNKEVSTPNLDLLAQRGARFANAFSPNAMCSPCRASLLTGMMPSQHGIHTWLDDHQMHLWPKEWSALNGIETLPEILAEAGYDTALIGKYHLGVPDIPQNGFRHWVTMDVGHVLSFYNSRIIDNGKRYVAEEHSVDFFTRKAIEYIREPSRTAPFFLALTYPAPYGHWPSIQGAPDNRFAELVRELPMSSIPREGIGKALIDWMMVRQAKMPGQESSYYNSLARLPNDLPTLRNFYSQMSMVDDGVGQIISALEEQEIVNETVIIYTADHGMSLGTHGFWGHGEDTWPSNMHREAYNVPLIVVDPRRAGNGSVLDTPVSTIDIFATILALAGIDYRETSTRPTKSLLPIIDHDRSEAENHVFIEQEETRAVRTTDYLYVERVRSSSFNFIDEYYDLVSDPDERTNLIRDPVHIKKAEAASGVLNNFFETFSEPRWNLWRGGSVKGNSTRPFLWQEMWGSSWKPGFD